MRTTYMGYSENSYKKWLKNDLKPLRPPLTFKRVSNIMDTCGFLLFAVEL
jgi:hypothetical protein